MMPSRRRDFAGQEQKAAVRTITGPAEAMFVSSNDSVTAFQEQGTQAGIKYPQPSAHWGFRASMVISWAVSSSWSRNRKVLFECATSGW